MKRWAILVVAALAWTATALWAAGNPFPPHAVRVAGVVRLVRGKAVSRLPQGAVLHIGDRVEVDKGSATLAWPDGSQARLEAGTRITLSGAAPGGQDGAITHARLDTGGMWLNVRRFARRPARFEVETNRSMGAVEGTEVLFRWNPETQMSTLQVWKGAVQCGYSDADGKRHECFLVRAGIRHQHRQDHPLSEHITRGFPRTEAWGGP